MSDPIVTAVLGPLSADVSVGAIPGPPGPTGPAGAGVPAGGTTGQVIVKSGATTVWQNQTRRLWVPGARFTANTGTPVLNADGLLLFDAAAVERGATTIVLPAWWLTCSVVLHWANAGAGTGAVKWSFRYDFIDAGQTIGTYTTMLLAGTTAGAVNVVVEQTQTGSITNIADAVMLCQVERAATDALDTLANDAGLIGVEFLQLT